MEADCGWNGWIWYPIWIYNRYFFRNMYAWHSYISVMHCFNCNSSCRDYRYCWWFACAFIKRKDVPIVFVTNYAEYVYQGYTVNALRYLKKPVLESDISPCLDIAYKHYTLCHQESSIIAIPGEQIVLQYAEILYLEACSPNLIIKRIGSSSDISFRYRISKVYPLLPSELFAFCHRSYIVNLSKIRILKRTQLVLCSNEVLPISEKYVDELFHKFNAYHQRGCC